METAEVIDPGFTVADGEDVRIRSCPEGLLLEFADWQENPIRVLFADAVSYSWDAFDWKFIEGERFDSTHIIHHSDWLREHMTQRAIEEHDNFRHYRLNFNACGTLQVLARGIEVQAEPQDRSK